MNGQAIITVAGAVVGLTQIAKWGGIPTRWAPVTVLCLSLLGVFFWGISQPTWARSEAFDYFAGWVSVTMTAAGVFGFSRGTAETVASFTAK